VLMIISVGLWGGSFKTLTPLECGLKINTISQQISTDHVYTSGRYFLGLGNGFLVYPTTLDFIDFSSDAKSNAPPLRASTSEGQSVILECSFQFRLKISKLNDLYRKYAHGYKGNYVTIAESALKNVVSQRYKTTDYFTQRSAIGEVMHGALQNALNPEFAVVEHFQLRKITVPPSTDNQILLTLVKRQQVELALVTRNSSVINSQTAFIVSQAANDVVVVNSRAQSEAKILVETAKAQAIEIAINATTQSYRKLMTELKFTPDELLQFLFYENVRLLEYPSSLALGVPGALFSPGPPTKPPFHGSQSGSAVNVRR